MLGNYVRSCTRAAAASCGRKGSKRHSSVLRDQGRGLDDRLSNIGDCVELALEIHIRSKHIRARVLGFHRPGEERSGGVEQVRRGECVELDPAARPVIRSRRFYWDPFAFLHAQHTIEDPGRAAESMRATVRSCTQALSGGHASLLHRLSGGLDSSIVAGCLGRPSTQPRITCYTYFNPHGRADERPGRASRPSTPASSTSIPDRPREISSPLGAPPRRERAVAAPRIPDAKHGRASTRRRTQGDGRVHRRRRRLRFCSDSFAYAVRLPEAPRSPLRSVAACI